MVADMSFVLLNYTAYSRNTHPIEHVDESGIGTISQDFVLTLDGNTDQLPTHSIVFNNITNLDQFKITNLRNNQVFTFTDENVQAWATNDTLVFNGLTKKATRNEQPQLITGRIPSFEKGRSKVRYEVVTSASQTVSNETSNSTLTSPFSSFQYGGQSFLTPIGGTITEIALRGEAGAGGPNLDPLGVEVAADSSGSPANTALATFALDREETDWAYYTGSLSITNATTYWLVKRIQGSGFGPRSNWDFQNTNVYANGTKATSPTRTGTWTTQTHDFAFIVTIEPTPSTDFDVLVESPILYN
jgi:hypothetical protein